MTPIRYKDYTIEETPAYARQYRYQFTHNEYTGAEDKRHGVGETLEECKSEIDILISEEKPYNYCHHQNCNCDEQYERMRDEQLFGE